LDVIGSRRRLLDSNVHGRLGVVSRTMTLIRVRISSIWSPETAAAIWVCEVLLPVELLPELIDRLLG
jgi:hypothetical protein